MNRYLELARERGETNPKYYNRCDVRDRQGQTRAKKTGGQYRPRLIRAPHDDPSKGGGRAA